MRGGIGNDYAGEGVRHGDDGKARHQRGDVAERHDITRVHGRMMALPKSGKSPDQ